MTVLTAAMLTAVCSSGLMAASGTGASGAQFLRVGVGARAAGMGGAFSPVADDATALYYNPAGLALLEKREIAATYNAYFKDSSSQFIGYAHPTESHGTLGISADLFGVRNIEQRSATAGDADTPDQGTFNTLDSAISLAWANRMPMMGGRLAYGGALKYINSNLHTASAKTGAIDMGAIFNMHEDGQGLAFSLAVLNLGGELKFQDQGDPLPLNIKPGVAYRMKFERYGRLTAALDSDLLVHDRRALVQPGLEWWPVEMFALRTGYQAGRSDGAGSGVAVGAGFRLQGLGIDYAFVPYGDLGDSHRITLGYRF